VMLEQSAKEDNNCAHRANNQCNVPKYQASQRDSHF